MPRVSAETLVMEEDAARNRRALATSVEEIGRRLRPKNLASLAQQRISSQAWKSLGELGEAIRSERGRAAVMAAGAVAAFYIGRSTQPRAHAKPSHDSFETTTRPPSRQRGLGLNLLTENTGKFAQNAKKLAAAVGAIATGYAIGSAAPISQPERDLMGDASARVKDYTAQFRRVHARGARIAAAQSVGIAQLAAAAIGLLGALAALVGDRDKSRQSSDAANRL